LRLSTIELKTRSVVVTLDAKSRVSSQAIHRMMDRYKKRMSFLSPLSFELQMPHQDWSSIFRELTATLQSLEAVIPTPDVLVIISLTRSHAPMTRSSNGSVSVVAVRLVTLLAGAIGGTILLLAGCAPPPRKACWPSSTADRSRRPNSKPAGENWPRPPGRGTRKKGEAPLLDELITRELLMQEARKQGLDQNDSIRDRAQRYREQLILDELLKDRIKAKVELSKEELDAFYEQHANELLTPLKVNVSLMLLPNISAAKDLEKQVNQGETSPSLRSAIPSTSKRKRKEAISALS